MAEHRPSSVREFLAGVGFLFRGFSLWRTSPGTMAIGLIPAAIVGALVLAAFVALAVTVDTLAPTLTPFADDWTEPWRSLLRVGVSAALLIALVLLTVATFTALTLAVGDPFFERIWLAVEHREGGFTRADDGGFWRSLGRGIVSGLRLLVPSVLVGILVFALGLIPAVGGVLAAVVGAVLGGGLLARELLARPFEGRGLDARQQATLRRSHRARITGFGTATYVVFLLPLGAVIAMPAAVAGSTLLARDLIDPSAVR
ncbi:EI24 domain-containing protein [Naasia lichenicola]|uniref:EI24 domain-containing protein n=1 Tax=Naasia lichenicola TaxID=2565933 RepID=A0A4S4FEX3_9MICO|nr:EI24 domain-containing protein [Naasia lichenicola]THG28730.1 hypothetical protein E6C64_18295 [Naasia lichenicola]